jgi:hypothetical protein
MLTADTKEGRLNNNDAQTCVLPGNRIGRYHMRECITTIKTVQQLVQQLFR